MAQPCVKVVVLFLSVIAVISIVTNLVTMEVVFDIQRFIEHAYSQNEHIEHDVRSDLKQEEQHENLPEKRSAHPQQEEEKKPEKRAMEILKNSFPHSTLDNILCETVLAKFSKCMQSKRPAECVCRAAYEQCSEPTANCHQWELDELRKKHTYQKECEPELMDSCEAAGFISP